MKSLIHQSQRFAWLYCQTMFKPCIVRSIIVIIPQTDCYHIGINDFYSYSLNEINVIKIIDYVAPTCNKADFIKIFFG